MKILVDADACPKGVLQICFTVGHRYGIQTWTVASFNHNIASDHHVVVGNASQEADMKVVNLTEAGDIIVTQDWGLAAMVLGKKARCLSPGGREYKEDNIEFLLEEREAKAKFRRAGGHTRGPKKRLEADDQKFAFLLETILVKHGDGSLRS